MSNINKVINCEYPENCYLKHKNISVLLTKISKEIIGLGCTEEIMRNNKLIWFEDAKRKFKTAF